MRFIQLSQPPRSGSGPALLCPNSVEWQQTAARLFPTLVRSSYLNLWRPGDPIASNGVRLLIGTYTWSASDMRLLDAVDLAVASEGLFGPVVDVFDLGSDCRTAADLQRYLPGMEITQVFNSPVVGVWREGVLAHRASGYAGRQLAAAMCGMNMQSAS